MPHFAQTMRIRSVLLSFRSCVWQISYNALRCLQAMAPPSQPRVGRCSGERCRSTAGIDTASQRRGRLCRLAIGRQTGFRAVGSRTPPRRPRPEGISLLSKSVANRDRKNRVFLCGRFGTPLAQTKRPPPTRRHTTLQGGADNGHDAVMPHGLYISADGAAAQIQRLEVIANNLANVDTAGFKRDLGIIQSRYAEADPARACLARRRLARRPRRRRASSRKPRPISLPAP